ncbi:hypothetical protein BS17DRAFT_94508 [Gyrodon lividus]|nr:hypothetical protein BS17DRAFT_94508 [Gyrodon lividus]
MDQRPTSMIAVHPTCINKATSKPPLTGDVYGLGRVEYPTQPIQGTSTEAFGSTKVRPLVGNYRLAMVGGRIEGRWPLARASWSITHGQELWKRARNTEASLVLDITRQLCVAPPAAVKYIGAIQTMIMGFTGSLSWSAPTLRPMTGILPPYGARIPKNNPTMNDANQTRLGLHARKTSRLDIDRS